MPFTSHFPSTPRPRPRQYVKSLTETSQTVSRQRRHNPLWETCAWRRCCKNILSRSSPYILAHGSSEPTLSNLVSKFHASVAIMMQSTSTPTHTKHARPLVPKPQLMFRTTNFAAGVHTLVTSLASPLESKGTAGTHRQKKTCIDDSSLPRKRNQPTDS